MNLTYSEDYWDDAEKKAAFNKFLKRIFNLDLTLWDKAGYWDYRFRPFSYFDGDKVVSNVCLYSLDMVVRGKRCKVAQVSSVGTEPEYRRQGLNRKLTEKAIDWANPDHDFFFLFADEEALPFYKRCGFRLRDEHKAVVRVSGREAEAEPEKLDPEDKDHLAMMFEYASQRTPVSEQLGVMNSRLFMFWCLYYLRGCIYYVSPLDVIVLFERKESVVTICDIVGRHIPSFPELYPYISHPADKTVEFLFMPDKLSLSDCDHEPMTGNLTHVFGDFPFEGGKFIFPLTSHA